MQFIDCSLEKTSGTYAYRLARVWIKEADQEEWHIVFPGYPPEAAEVWNSDEVVVTIVCVADLQFPEVSLVMHVPSEDNGAESEALLGNSQELLLRDQLSAQ